MGWQFWFQFVPVVVFLILGLLSGTFLEKRHFKSLARREAAMRDIMVTNLRALPTGCAVAPVGLVTGEVVVASDYFKTFVANIKKLIGGELRTFETLMERARREALLRMMDHAKAMGANRVLNVRFESSNIGSMRRNKGAAMVEMYAYGTAVHVADQAVG